jgi:hypothetical protein
MNENDTTHKDEIKATMAFKKSLVDIIPDALISAAPNFGQLYGINRF